MTERVVVEVPLSLLARMRPRPHYQSKVVGLAACYLSGVEVPPIPVRLQRVRRKRLELAGDGNHRLAAARLAGVEMIRVSLSAMDFERCKARVVVHSGAPLPRGMVAAEVAR